MVIVNGVKKDQTLQMKENNNDIISKQMALDEIDQMPTVTDVDGVKYIEKTCLKIRINMLRPMDAVPIVHGRWETDGMMMDDGEYLMTRCTACGEAYEYGYNMPFCPRCGAKMDGEDDNDEQADRC